MQLDFDAQRAFCADLGLIDATTDRTQLSVWYDDPTCQRVSNLLTMMGTQKDKMDSAARWIRSDLDSNDQRFAGDEVHSVTSLSHFAQQAVAYDTAAAVYASLQEQLQSLVISIRRDAGYDVSAFSRLEDHPVLTPDDDAMVRELHALRSHLADFSNRSEGGMRRHLIEEHGAKRADVRDLYAASLEHVHDKHHAPRIDELVAEMERIQSEHPMLSVSTLTA